MAILPRQNYRSARSAGIPLVCLPYAAGSAVAFRAWKAWLAPRFEVVAIDIPGHGRLMDSNCLNTIGEMAEWIKGSACLLNFEDSLIFGHSMGALVAYDLCAKLQKEGVSPRGLIVSGARPPDSPRPSTLRSSWDDQQLLDTLMRYDVTTNEIIKNKEFRAFLLRMVRADFAACDAYFPSTGPRLNIPLAAMCGEHDSEVEMIDMKRWGVFTTQEFYIEKISGGHMCIESNRREFVLKLSALAGLLLR